MSEASALMGRPQFSIRAVVEHTGVSADALRAWEMRYGLPKPARSAGGHRLYSHHDIQMVRWLQQRLREGQRIGQAVEAWKDLQQRGETPLAFERPSSGPGMPGNQIDKLQQAWVEACMSFDETSANQIMDEAFARFTPETVCMDLLAAGMHEIGERWASNEVSVAQEHFASGMAVRRISMLIASARPNLLGRSVLVACPEEEEHSIAALLISFFLRRAGANVVFLGANLPLHDLRSMKTLGEFEVAVLVGESLASAPALAEMAAFLESEGIAVGYGGHVYRFSELLRKHISGTYLGDDFAGVGERAVALEAINPGSKKKATTSKKDSRLKAIQANKEALADDLVEAFRAEEHLNAGSVREAAEHLSVSLASALTFGEPSLLGIEIAWLNEYLGARGIKSEMRKAFLDTYQRLIVHRMGEPGSTISSFFQAAAPNNAARS